MGAAVGRHGGLGAAAMKRNSATLFGGGYSMEETPRERRNEQLNATQVLRRIFEVLHPRGATPEARAARLLENVNATYWMEIEPLTKANLRACADTMRAIADQWKDDSDHSQNLQPPPA